MPIKTFDACIWYDICFVAVWLIPNSTTSAHLNMQSVFELERDIKLLLFFICSLAGVSRSVTITAAYVMTVTNLGWRDTLQAIRGARSCANPNFGFQRQLQNYENEGLEKVCYPWFMVINKEAVYILLHT